MIISCEKCNKKFEISNHLIPDKGRVLQCGSCSYQWHYIPVDRIKSTTKVKKIDITVKKKKTLPEEKISKNNVPPKNKKKVGFLSYTLVMIVSFIALIIILDTFKLFFSSYIPGFDFYLSNLYESMKDISLFFKDLIK